MIENELKIKNDQFVYGNPNTQVVKIEEFMVLVFQFK